MLISIEGIYRNGKIELTDSPGDVPDDTRVIATFLPPDQGIDLREHGIDEAQAAEMRARLSTFAEDWESPEMAIYGNYDAAKASR